MNTTPLSHWQINVWTETNLRPVAVECSVEIEKNSKSKETQFEIHTQRKQLMRYRDICDFQVGGRHHLGFFKFEILTMRHSARYNQKRSYGCRYVAI